MIFFLIASGMVLVAALTLALPLWRGRVPESAGAADANRLVHASRLEELDSDLEAGRLSRDDYAAARGDLETDLAGGLAQRYSGAAAGPERLWAAIAAVLVLAIAGGLYWGYGNWRN